MKDYYDIAACVKAFPPNTPRWTKRQHYRHLCLLFYYSPSFPILCGLCPLFVSPPLSCWLSLSICSFIRKPLVWFDRAAPYFPPVHPVPCRWAHLPHPIPPVRRTATFSPTCAVILPAYRIAIAMRHGRGHDNRAEEPFPFC